MLIEMLAMAACAAEGDAAARSIGEARAAFNNAIADAEIEPIADVLADAALLISGTDSDQFIGATAQIDIWRADFRDEKRLIYARKTGCVKLSPLYPIAMEEGVWRGAPEGNDADFVGGVYAAKWRLIDGVWRIEAETFMTTECGGAFCPRIGSDE